MDIMDKVYFNFMERFILNMEKFIGFILDGFVLL